MFYLLYYWKILFHTFVTISFIYTKSRAVFIVDYYSSFEFERTKVNSTLENAEE